MKLSNIAKIILDMKGKMPESSRHLLAMKILKDVGLHLQEKGGTLVKEWQDSGAPAAFMRACEFNSGPPWVNHDIAIHDTDLANFINRWMNVERIRRSGDSEWEPLTADQNDIRVRMVEELKTIWRLQSGTEDQDGTDEEVQEEA